MKSKFTLSLGLLLSLLVACKYTRISDYDDANIKATHVQSMVGPFPDAHGRSSRNDLEVFGKTYSEVTGFKPYFIKIPEINSIIFSAFNENEMAETLYLINLSTKQETKIKPKNFWFGAYQDTSFLEHGGDYCYVAKAEVDGLTLVRIQGGINGAGKQQTTAHWDTRNNQLKIVSEQEVPVGADISKP